MAPATKTTAGAGPGLVAHHADRGGALSQLWHLSRCYGASGPGKSPSGLQGPALRGLSKALPGPGGGCCFVLPRAPSGPGCFVGVGSSRSVDSGFARESAGPGPRLLRLPFLTVGFPNSASSAHPPHPPLILIPSLALQMALKSFSFPMDLSPSEDETEFSRGQKCLCRGGKSAINLGKVFSSQKFVKSRRGALFPDFNEGLRFHLFSTVWGAYYTLQARCRALKVQDRKLPVLSPNVPFVRETSEK